MKTEENEVLFATVEYLIMNRKALPYKVSVATGKGIDLQSIKLKIKDRYKPTGREPKFAGYGPDIMAVSEKEW